MRREQRRGSKQDSDTSRREDTKTHARGKAKASARAGASPVPWAEQVEGGGEVDLNESLHFSSASGASSQKTPDVEQDGQRTPPYFASSARDLTGSSFENDELIPSLMSSSANNVAATGASDVDVSDPNSKRVFGRGRGRKPRQRKSENEIGVARGATPESDDAPRVGRNAPRNLNSNPSIRRVDVTRPNADVQDVTERFDGLVIRNENLPASAQEGQRPERGSAPEARQTPQRSAGRRDGAKYERERRDERSKKEPRTAWDGQEGGRGNTGARRGGERRGSARGGGRGGATFDNGGRGSGRNFGSAKDRSPYAVGRETVEKVEKRKAILAARAIRHRRDREDVTSSDHDSDRHAPARERLSETQSCPNQQQNNSDTKRFSSQRRNAALRARSDTESTNEHLQSSDDDATRRRVTKLREAQYNREAAAQRRRDLQSMQQQRKLAQNIAKSPHQSDTESATDGGDVTPVNPGSPRSDRLHKTYYDPYRLFERKDRHEYEEELRQREERRGKQPQHGYQARSYQASHHPREAYEQQQASSARLASLPPRFHNAGSNLRRSGPPDRRSSTPSKSLLHDSPSDRRAARDGRLSSASDRDVPSQRRGSFDELDRITPRPSTRDGELSDVRSAPA